jgi:multidrug efflux pump subunit AcrA (membrane-fusion protein)
MFAVSVDVPKVSKKDQKDLRVGMTAKIEIQIKKPPKVMIPIDAVFSKRGEIYVTQVDPKTGQRKNVPVETGPTTENNVVIIEGIKAGDKVVVYHKVQAHDKAR